MGKEHGDFASEFEAIVGELEAEQRDPIVTDVFNSVNEADIALARAGDGANDYYDDVIARLNGESEEAGITGRPVIVSGKIRPSEFVGMNHDGQSEVILPVELGELGQLQHDEYGDYYSVFQQRLIGGDFDIDEITADDDTVTERKVILYLNPNEDDDPSDGWLYTYPDDLEYLAPEEPSYLKINQEIRQRYEEIARQLDSLPADCGDDEAIIAALRDMELELNWHDYPRHLQEERDELIDHIEQYITNRVVFDTSLYMMSVHGVVIGVNERDQRFVQPVIDGTPISGYVGHVRLLREVREDNDDEDIAHYRLMLEVFMPSAERGSGDYLVYVPLASIDAIGNTRNGELFSQPMGLFEHPFEPAGVVPAGATSEIEESSDDDVDAPEYTVQVDVGREMPAREQELAALDERIHELYTQVDAIISKLYDSQEEAVEAQQRIDKLIEAFNELYPRDVMTVLEAEGPGVRSMNVQLDGEGSQRDPSDTGSVTLKFDGVRMVESDILTVKRGVYAFHAITGIGPAEAVEGKYGVEALMVFADIDQPAPITFGSPELSLPLFTLSASKRFIVRIDSDDAHLTIPEYERLKKCRDIIQSIALKFPDLQYLPWQLTELQETIDAADPTDFAELEDIALVRHIGESVGGDEEASQHTVDALMEILGEHPIEITGPMYTSDGSYTESNEIQGLVENVISTHTAIPTAEPMLMMTTLDNTWYVPLSTIERFRY